MNETYNFSNSESIISGSNASLYTELIVSAGLMLGLYITGMFYIRCTKIYYEEENTINTVEIPEVHNIISDQNTTLSSYDFFEKVDSKNLDIIPQYCPICLEDMQDTQEKDNESLIRLRNCGHVCHSRCMEKWINTKVSSIRCLTCQKPVLYS